jgi:hypothetical protein
MPSESTRLLSNSAWVPTTHRAVSTPDLISAALCVVLKLFAFWLRHLSDLPQPNTNSFILIFVLSQVADRAVPFFWSGITCSFELGTSKIAGDVVNDPEKSNDAIKAAIKANRKASSIPYILEAFLDLSIDQPVICFRVFSNAGCSWRIGFGASMAMLCFPIVLQLRPKGLVSKVSACRRRKETDL